MISTVLLLIVIGLTAKQTIGQKDQPDGSVKHLIGEPDFRDVQLQWEYDELSSPTHETPKGFQIRYCELQAWGPHRCRTRLVDNAEEITPNASNRQTQLKVRKTGRKSKMYSAKIDGLRMATTYSFEVKPFDNFREERSSLIKFSESVIIPTKGFSARATQCLPHASEVEVSTGPYFGGRIAVEAADGERCAVSGDPNSGRDTYTLRIDHEECGSEVNETTVATFVIVQENLPILTHSTRRFLVLCSYKPETLTVRAGINLPATGNSPNVRYYRPQSGQAEPYDFQDDRLNEVRPARLEAKIVESSSGNIAQEIIIVMLVVGGMIGVAFFMWKIITGSKTEEDNVSVTSYNSTNSRNLYDIDFENNSDSGSIYSISLSECGHCGDNRKHGVDCDNTSEA